MGLIDVLSIELTQKKLSYTETTSSIIYELFYNVSALMIVYVRIYATRITNNGKGEREAPLNLPEERTSWDIPSVSPSFPI